jgi:hypothetical protein
MTMRKAFLLALALLGTAQAVSAQIRTGNVYGSVTDSSGAVLPGVTVTISGDLGRRTTTSGHGGEFRFLTLDVGRYQVALSLAGFKTVTREIVVATGDEMELAFVMPLAAVEETVTVEAESPLVSTKKRGTSTTMTAEELGSVPNARDPWGVLKSVPGVLVSVVNIAGNYNGQQAAFVAKGAWEQTWNLDGLNITDLSSGASASYYDFGAFQEVNVTTGGADVRTQAGGIGVNLVTRRGTNRFHGSARYLLSHDSLQRSNLPAELKGDPRLEDPDGTSRDKADHIRQIGDYGFELGGPILKDKLWFYGTWGKQDIRVVRLEGTPDKTLITAYNAKLNWQATPRTMVSAFYFNSVKEKYGRTPGTGLQEADSFLFNQANMYEKGGLPGGLWKVEVNQTFSPDLFVTASAAYFDNGFGLFPRGGPDQSYTLDYDKGVAYGSSSDYTAVRPQKHLNVDGHYFFAGLGGRHELKFGFGYRDYVTTSTSHFNGNQLAGVVNSPTDRLVQVWRDYGVKYAGKYYSVYAGDVYTRDRFSVNAGLRWDVQRARNLPYTTPANASFPNLLPAVEYAGDAGDIIRWSEPSPRVGLSWALDESRKTVLRASYARYAQQLYFGNVTYENPGSYSFLAYGWTDRNGDGFVQPDEALLDQYLYSYNVDPSNPAVAGTTANRVDRELKPARDQEVVVGLDRELAGGLAVGVAYTWRQTDGWWYYPWLAGPCTGEPTVATCPLIGAGDYTPNAPVTANGFTAFTYSPDPALVAAGGGGRLTTNHPGYHTTFNGLELTLIRRLSNRWMARVAFSWNDWVDRFERSVPRVNYWGNPTAIENDPLVDGGQVAMLAGGGAGKGSFYSSVKWQLYANALVQLPWKLDLSGALFARQGGPYPKSLRLRAGADGTIPALAQDQVDRDRYDDVWDLDLRLGKNVDVRGARLTLSAEWFNAFNAGTVLARYRWPNNAAFTSPDPTKGRIEQVVSPSILRLGATLSF